MVGGIILAVIEGLNIALVRMFSNMGPPPDEPISMAAPGADADAGAQSAAEQPWWAKLIGPAPAPPDVDFSDPKEVRLLTPTRALSLQATHLSTHTKR
jgi:hypothetical protein